jgi:hypothetical protein
MTTSMPERVIPGWVRSISPRRAGIMVLILVVFVWWFLFACSGNPIMGVSLPHCTRVSTTRVCSKRVASAGRWNAA